MSAQSQNEVVSEPAPAASDERPAELLIPPSPLTPPAGGATTAGLGPRILDSAEIASYLRGFVVRAIAESPAAARARTGRERFFPGVPDAQWFDWRWQFRNRLTTLEELFAKLPFPQEEWTARREVLRDFRMGITPYYLTLMDPGNPEDPPPKGGGADDPLARQVVPLREEYDYRAVGDEDPLGEENFSPVPGITHRYPDRALMVVTNSCAIYCRYCTRKRIMYEDAVPEMELAAMIDYIARTPSIRDVIVSGGDPLTFSTDKLEKILSRLRAIPHVEVIRIGTRVPVSLPMRVTDELCRMLERYHPLWINVHYNHANEITPDAARACDKLIRAGIPLNNQAVLLRGVNDSVAAIRELIHGLMLMRVRPYYLYICDNIRGSEHFRTTVAKGIEIMEGLRGHTSGLAIPQFVVDAPGGGGKIPVSPQYLLAYDNGRAVLRNFQGKVFEYFDPIRPHEDVGRMPPAKLENRALPATIVRNGFVRPDAVAKLGPGIDGQGANWAHVAAKNGNGHANGNGNGAMKNLSVIVQPVNGNGNGHGHGNGHGNGNGHGHGNGKDLPVVGKSSWAHRRNGPNGCGG